MCQTKLKYFQNMHYNLGPSMDKPSTRLLKMGWAMLPGLSVDNMRNETVTAAPLSQNKASFKVYAMAFEESRQAIDKNRVEREAIEKPTICASTTSARPRGGSPIHNLYRYVPPNRVVILKLLI